MCNFFSFVTEPENNGGKRFYFNWAYRKKHLKDDPQPSDSHSSICQFYKMDQDICNRYEYNPLTKVFLVDTINSKTNDSIQAQEWVEKLDFKKVVPALKIQPIANPFELPEKELTEKDKELLEKWASVVASVGASVWASVRDSVVASVRDSVWDSVVASVRDSVRDSVVASVWDSVGDSVGAYSSNFFDIEYPNDYSPLIELWNSGIVPSFDGTTGRLHTGKNAKVIYEWKK